MTVKRSILARKAVVVPLALGGLLGLVSLTALGLGYVAYSIALGAWSIAMLGAFLGILALVVDAGRIKERDSGEQGPDQECRTS